MNEEEHFFKNEDEIRAFFAETMFQFQYRVDSVLTYKTIEPIEVGGNYNKYQVELFDNGDVIFNFCRLSGKGGFLDAFQIFNVTKLSSERMPSVELYLKKFDEDDSRNEEMN